MKKEMEKQKEEKGKTTRKLIKETKSQEEKGRKKKDKE